MAFLLGSGASKEAGILPSTEWNNLFEELPSVKNLKHAIVRYKSLKQDPFDIGDPNDGEKVVRALAILASEQVTKEFEHFKSACKDIPSIVAREAFRSVATRLKEECTIREGSDNLRYLGDLINFANWRTSPGRSKMANIFTLNYDNSIEFVAAHIGYTCVSMPSLLSKETRLSQNVEVAGISLLKINGSADWSFHKHKTGFRIAEFLLHGDDRWTPDVENVCFLDLIYTPSSQELAAYQKDELVKRLAETSFLVVLGYSFRRTDINALLFDWASSSRSQQITIYDENPSILHEQFQEQCKGIVRCKLEQTTTSQAIETFYR